MLTWRQGDTIPLTAKRTLRVPGVHDDDSDEPPVLVVEDLPGEATSDSVLNFRGFVEGRVVMFEQFGAGILPPVVTSRRVRALVRSLLDWGQPSGYETRPPSSRTALDAIPSGEWTSQLPEGLGGGEVPLFADERVAWLLAQVDVAGLRVLELGPLEGGHSYMLQRAGAQQVVAVEANRRAFLRCLAVQAALGLDRVEFLCGDFVGYLRALDRRFDLVVASGVLYHARDPVELLGLLGDASDRLFVWTHYYDRELLPRHLLERFDEEGPPYRYAYGSKARSFCGGGAAHSYWLDRPTIERTLQGLGYQLQVAFEEPGHVNGPALALLALR